MGQSETSRPRLLDLFCGAGGAAVGYHRAGFDVVGVDIAPQPNYPFRFIQRDAFDWMDPECDWWFPFDAIHASPPCQAYSSASENRRASGHPELLLRTRELLQASGLPYVIENVPGAPMPEAFLLCGVTFGLPIIRHRLFEVRPPIGLVPSLCHQGRYGRGVEHPGAYPYAHGVWRPAWRKYVLPAIWPWMTLEESGEAIPPAYTEWIGERLMAEIQAQRAAA